MITAFLKTRSWKNFRVRNKHPLRTTVCFEQADKDRLLVIQAIVHYTLIPLHVIVASRIDIDEEIPSLSRINLCSTKKFETK